eukprot:TRINITY_DN83328_c0_g1_i1.p1 TRINITY_DN83328_c0_g1~~TRINITY_DN83328_c0_g1_i1.p1  ORF type:complete len:144 (+),score=27.08 TRINITY_DN83328_c0_g1_i1:123-554(+)
MSVLAAVSRQVAARGSPALRIARRNLGDTVAGPQITDVQGNLKQAINFFAKTPLSYAEYKQQCVSLRLFAFAGVTGFCALSLIVDPPKSSCWVRYGPSYWFSSIRQTFSSTSPPIFLNKKANHDADVPAIAGELISKRLAGKI